MGDEEAAIAIVERVEGRIFGFLSLERVAEIFLLLKLAVAHLRARHNKSEPIVHIRFSHFNHGKGNLLQRN